MIMSANDIILAACRAHTPQFDRMDAEIRQYAIEQMRAAIIVAVTDLVKAGRSVLDNGADPEDGAFEDALEPFEALIPYESTVEADISAAIKRLSGKPELQYVCDSCSGVPGYGTNTTCQCISDSAPVVTDGMIAAAKSAYWHEVHNGGGYSDKCYEAAIRSALQHVAKGERG